MTHTLFIFNDCPYGSERPFNGLRLAASLSQHEAAEVRVFFFGDGILCAKSGQRPPQVAYNVEQFVGTLVDHGADLAACGTCMATRGLAAHELVEGVHEGTLDEVAQWTQWANKVVVF